MLRLSSLFVVALCLVAGCTTEPEQKASAPLDFPTPKTTLTIQESGKVIPLRVGEYVMISLRENPSTGYSWFFRLDNGKGGPQPRNNQAVELLGERFLPPEVVMPGAAGTREIMIKAVRPGSVYVIGNCVRPTDKNQDPAESVRFVFEVTR